MIKLGAMMALALCAALAAAGCGDSDSDPSGASGNGGSAGGAGAAGSAGASGQGGSGAGAAGSSAGSAGSAGAGCAPVWKVELAEEAQGTAAIADGAMVLSGSSTSAKALSGYNKGATLVASTPPDLKGDFEVTVSFEGFTPGGAGAFLQAGVIGQDKDGFFYQIGGHAGGDEDVEAALVDTTSVKLETGDVPGLASGNVSGVFVFKRAGKTASSTATVGGVKVASTSADFPDLDMKIFLGIGATKDPVSQPTTARITEVVITGGPLSSDTFDCNSLTP